jgi:hypothetical protein
MAVAHPAGLEFTRRCLRRRAAPDALRDLDFSESTGAALPGRVIVELELTTCFLRL